MTDAEISLALALAIGWPDWAVATTQTGRIYVWTPECGREFDYRDPTVIWPIAERYNFFPVRWANGTWNAAKMGVIAKADTAAKAVALAVIGGKA